MCNPAAQANHRRIMITLNATIQYAPGYDRFMICKANVAVIMTRPFPHHRRSSAGSGDRSTGRSKRRAIQWSSASLPGPYAKIASNMAAHGRW
jgi:hypothetical protein